MDSDTDERRERHIAHFDAKFSLEFKIIVYRYGTTVNPALGNSKGTK
jgi:hypothetical protein